MSDWQIGGLMMMAVWVVYVIDAAAHRIVGKLDELIGAVEQVQTSVSLLTVEKPKTESPLY